MKDSDRYLKIVQWSEEDNCYVGTCPGLMLGGVHGDNELEVYAQLSQAVEECIQIYKEDGESLPEPSEKETQTERWLRLSADDKQLETARKEFAAKQWVELKDDDDVVKK